MTLPRSLQARLGLSIGVVLTVLWIAAASVTAVILNRELREVFDSTLQETAQRILRSPSSMSSIATRII